MITWLKEGGGLGYEENPDFIYWGRQGKDFDAYWQTARPISLS